MKSYRMFENRKLTLWLFQFKEQLHAVEIDGNELSYIVCRGNARDQFLTFLAENTQAVTH